MATHSSILAWRIPWIEEPCRLQSMGSQEWDTTQQLNHQSLRLGLKNLASFYKHEFWLQYMEVENLGIKKKGWIIFGRGINQSCEYSIRNLNFKNSVCVCVLVTDSLQPHGLQPARLPCPWASPGKSTGVQVPFSFPGDLSDPGIKPRSPASQADFYHLSYLGSL